MRILNVLLICMFGVVFILVFFLTSSSSLISRFSALKLEEAAPTSSSSTLRSSSSLALSHFFHQQQQQQQYEQHEQHHEFKLHLPLPLDVRTLGSSSRFGGFGSLNSSAVPLSRTWIVVRRADALRWFSEKFGAVIGFPSSDSSSVSEWSCSIGKHRPMPSQREVDSVGWGPVPRAFFAYDDDDDRFVHLTNISSNTVFLGPGWGADLSPLAAAKIPVPWLEQLTDLGRDLPPMRSWSQEAIFSVCVGTTNSNNHSSAPSTAPSSSSSSSTNSTSTSPPLVPKTSVWSLPETERALGIPSIAASAVGQYCSEDILVLDGHAPSFAHAMSRRCKNVTEMRSRQLFIAGIGHSHTRLLTAQLCMLSHHRHCSDYSKWAFHVPTVPMKSNNWWEQQVVPVQSRQRHDDDAAVDPSMQFKLFYSANFYDSRAALVRLLTHLLDRDARDSLELEKNITAPRIEDAYDEYLGYGTQQGREQHRRWDREIVAWVQQIRPHFAVAPPSHFIVSQGEWHMHFSSPRLDIATRQLADFLSLLHELFPRSVIILQLPQRHIAMEHRKFGALQKWRHTCASELRVQALREMSLCAARLAIDKAESSSSSSGSSLKEKLVLFDSDKITRASVGVPFVDVAGHHQTDVTLDVLASEIRHIVSSDEVQQLYSQRAWTKLLKHARSGFCHKILGDETNDENWIEHLPRSIAAHNRTSSSSSSPNASSAPCYVPKSWIDVMHQRAQSQTAETVVMETPASTAKRLAAVEAAMRRGERCVTYSELVGFPPRPGSAEEQCTCHRDVPLKKMFCDTHPRIPNKRFAKWQEMFDRAREIRHSRRTRRS